MQIGPFFETLFNQVEHKSCMNCIRDHKLNLYFGLLGMEMS